MVCSNDEHNYCTSYLMLPYVSLCNHIGNIVSTGCILTHALLEVGDPWPVPQLAAPSHGQVQVAGAVLMVVVCTKAPARQELDQNDKH